MEKLHFQDDDELIGFEKLIISQPDDYEGRVVCTLVRMKSAQRKKMAVLHVHGFNDYFFHEETARQFFLHHIDFYAVDVRKSGRSILPHQKMNTMRDVQEQFDDIKKCLEIIRQLHHGPVILFGHSLGGLIAALFAEKYKNMDLFDAIFLNSPFFEQNKDVLTRKLLIPAVASLGKKRPQLLVPGGFSRFYGPSLHVNDHGLWQYNLSWKPHVAALVNAGWVRAVYQAQKKLQSSIAINVPVLLAYPKESYAGFRWNKKFMSADAVVNVKHIEKYASSINASMEILVVKDAVHDLFLSAPEIRGKVINEIIQWIDRIFPEKRNQGDKY